MNIPFKFACKEYAKKSKAPFPKKPIIIKIKIEESELLNLRNWNTPDKSLVASPASTPTSPFLNVEIKGNIIKIPKPSERPDRTVRKKTT